MLEETIVVSNKLGLHARPAAALAKVAEKYASEITVKRIDDENTTEEGVNCKSLLALLMLSAANGTNLKFTVDGSDANDALHEIIALFENKFGEE